MKCLLILAFSFGLSSFAHSQASEDVWVGVSVMDGGLAREVHEYYGTLDRKTFEGLTDMIIQDGLFRLSNVVWLRGSKISPMKDTRDEGESRGYSNTVYLRSSTITRMILLNDQFVEDKILPVLSGVHAAEPAIQVKPSPTPLPRVSFDILRAPEKGSFLK